MGRDRTHNQFIAQAAAMTTGAVLSVIGSSLIVNMVRRDVSSVYHRILIMLSIGDIIFSLSNTVHLFLVPGDRTDSPIANGNDSTCNALGFILNGASMYISAYNAFLATNFYLQIGYKWTNEQVAKKIEPTVHFIAFVLATAFPIIALVRDTYALDSNTGTCLMGSYSEICEDVVVPINHTESAFNVSTWESSFDATIDSNGAATTTIQECKAGPLEFDYMTNVVTFILGILGGIGIISTVGLYRAVYSTYSANQRYAVTAQPSAAIDGEESRGRRSQSAIHVPSPREERLKQVTWQCVMYGVIYCNTFVWAFAFGVIYWTTDVSDDLGHPAIFTLVLLCSFFFSAQGFFNFGVFIWSKYQKTRKAAERRLRQIVAEQQSSRAKPQSNRNLQINAPAQQISAQGEDDSIPKISSILILYWTIKEVDLSKMSFSERSFPSLYRERKMDEGNASSIMGLANNRKTIMSISSRPASAVVKEVINRAAANAAADVSQHANSDESTDPVPSRPDSARTEDEESRLGPQLNEGMQANQTSGQPPSTDATSPSSSSSSSSKCKTINYAGDIR